MVPLIVRLAARELRYRWRLMVILGLAIAAGTGALVAIGALTERIGLALTAESAALMGGDIRITARRDLRQWADELPPELRPQLVTLEMPTMAVAGEFQRLTELKAVDTGYPLYGELLIESRDASGAPPRGQVWVEPSLLQQLNVTVGEEIDIGYTSLTIGGIIRREPDRVAGVFSIGPRILINKEDLPATGLLQPGSRFETHLLYRLPANRAVLIASRLRDLAPPGVNVETVKTGVEQTRSIIRQTGDFLRITAQLGLILAAAAVFVAANHLAERSAATVAILKSLGASSRLVVATYLGVLGLVGALGGLLGGMASLGLQHLLPLLLRDLLPESLPPASGLSLSQGIVTATALTFAAGGYRLWRLAATSPNRILRGTMTDASQGTWWVQVAILLLGLMTLMGWLSDDPGLVIQSLLFTVVLLGCVACVAAALLRGLGTVSRGTTFMIRHAMNGLRRGGPQTLLSITALAVATTALLGPLLIRTDLVRQWTHQAPADAPNRFLIDVQPHQVTSVERILAAHQAEGAWLRPMVRARLAELNGVSIDAVPKRSSRAQRMATRENNLTFGSPEPYNTLTAGRWWQARPEVPEISLEQDWAALFDIEIGDTMTFDVAGQRIQGVVTSLRRVNWESMRSNFFVVFSPGALEEFPHTYITSYRVAATQASRLQSDLVAAHPNLTVIDIGQLVETVQTMIGRASLAMTFLSLFTLAAGLAVLATISLSERDRIAGEVALLRALGGGDAQIRSLFLLRFTLLGLISAGLGAGGAITLAMGASWRFLGVPAQISTLPIAVVVVITTMLIGLVSIAGAGRALATPPLRLLRQSS